MAVNLNREDIIFQNLGDERPENGIVEEDERDRALEEEDGGKMGHEDASELEEGDVQDAGDEVENKKVNGGEEEHVNDEEVAEKPAETAMGGVTLEDNGDAAIDAVHQVKDGDDEDPREEAEEEDLEGKKEATSGGVKKVLKSGVFGGKYLERWQLFYLSLLLMVIVQQVLPSQRRLPRHLSVLLHLPDSPALLLLPLGLALPQSRLLRLRLQNLLRLLQLLPGRLLHQELLHLLDQALMAL